MVTISCGGQAILSDDGSDSDDSFFSFDVFRASSVISDWSLRAWGKNDDYGYESIK